MMVSERSISLLFIVIITLSWGWRLGQANLLDQKAIEQSLQNYVSLVVSIWQVSMPNETNLPQNPCADIFPKLSRAAAPHLAHVTCEGKNRKNTRAHFWMQHESWLQHAMTAMFWNTNRCSHCRIYGHLFNGHLSSKFEFQEAWWI